jgi:hypothetical protein
MCIAPKLVPGTGKGFRSSRTPAAPGTAVQLAHLVTMQINTDGLSIYMSKTVKLTGGHDLVFHSSQTHAAPGTAVQFGAISYYAN